MAFRNPFDSWGNSIPKAKPFGIPNHGTSIQDQFFRREDSHQLFGNKMRPMPSDQAPERRAPGSDWSSYLTELSDIYTKQGPAETAYNQHLEAMPEYQSPGGWHKFGSALVGFAEGLQGGAASGFHAGQEALMSPYRRSLDEWGMKEQALGRRAEQEDKASGRRLSFMKEVRGLAKDEEEARRWMDEYDLDVRKQDADEEYKNAQIENWKAQGYVKDYDDKGNLVFVNPRTGDVKRFGPSSKKTDWAYEERRTRSGEVSAGAAARNAATNSRRTDIYGRDVDEDNARADRTQQRYENPAISPQDQAAARGSALNRAAVETPEWADFLDAEGNINPRTINKNREQFKKFMERVEEIEDGILGRRRVLGGVGGGGGVIDY